MTVAAFVLGIVAIVLATVSLTWQVWVYRLRVAVPELVPFVGVRSSNGIVMLPAGEPTDESLGRIASTYDGELLVGVEVINRGRGSVHVSNWGMSAEPGGPTWLAIDDPPAEIPKGCARSFSTDLQQARDLAAASAAEGDTPKQIVLTLWADGRRHRTEPIATALLEFDHP